MMTPKPLHDYLRHPRQRLRELDAMPQRWSNLPHAVWGQLTAIAVIVSLVYGASLSLVLPDLNM
jgi:hypothetical protein